MSCPCSPKCTDVATITLTLGIVNNGCTCPSGSGIFTLTNNGGCGWADANLWTDSCGTLYGVLAQLLQTDDCRYYWTVQITATGGTGLGAGYSSFSSPTLTPTLPATLSLVGGAADPDCTFASTCILSGTAPLLDCPQPGHTPSFRFALKPCNKCGCTVPNAGCDFCAGNTPSEMDVTLTGIASFTLSFFGQDLAGLTGCPCGGACDTTCCSYVWTGTFPATDIGPLYSYAITFAIARVTNASLSPSDPRYQWYWASCEFSVIETGLGQVDFAIYGTAQPGIGGFPPTYAPSDCAARHNAPDSFCYPCLTPGSGNTQIPYSAVPATGSCTGSWTLYRLEQGADCNVVPLCAVFNAFGQPVCGCDCPGTNTHSRIWPTTITAHSP